MKILQINKYHYVRGGSDSVYFNTSKLLKEYGHEVIHFAMEFKENETSQQSEYFAVNEDFTEKSAIKKATSLPAFFYNHDAEIKLKALIIKERPDIAHLHIFYGSLTSSILKVLKNQKIPIVVSVHDYKFVCPAYLFLNGENKICEKCAGQNYYQAIQNKCIKGSYLFSTIFSLEAYFRDAFYPLNKMFSKLIFVSNFAANKHIQYKPELNEISTHLYNFDPTIDNQIPNHNKGKYFLYAGRLSKEKGLTTLINAFTQLPNLKLKVVGSGAELPSLMKIAGNNVEFLGFKKNHELRKIISDSSYIVVPSEWYENNPMSIIESYSQGKPVIASKIGGIPEIIEDKRTGYLFTPGDISALVDVIRRADQIKESEYREMSKYASDYAKRNFHPQVHYNQLISIYRQAIANQTTFI